MSVHTWSRYLCHRSGNQVNIWHLTFNKYDSSKLADLIVLIALWSTNYESDMARHCIYRDDIKVAEVDHPTTSIIDSGLEPETEYTYTMTAVDDEGNEGDFSDPDSATTDAEPVDQDLDWAALF